ncbi:MAG: AAA family ATPase, partial [candidate division Zixibacteria bacterium]|nr:AAA family ATPase [candidate division Zixibacteria bacterium]
VDIILDLGNRLVPVEVKAGMTVVADFFKGLDKYCALAGVESGVLVTGGSETRRHGRHLIRTWSDCS